MTDTAEKKANPPYLPYSTLRGFIELLHNTALPNFIDKSLMRHISGGVQSHLMVALRFLQLVSSKNEVTPRLESLHSAFGNPDAWSEELKKIIFKSYLPIVGELDVSKATDGQLDDAFRKNASLEGTMLDRATRFYIQALQDAKVPISPHLLSRKPRTPKRSTPKSVKNGIPGAATSNPRDNPQDGVPADPPVKEVLPVGMMRLPVYIPGKPVGRIDIHEDLVEADVAMISAILMAYAKRRATSKE